ncbi:hypothetical protein JTB14_021759 [Gonioctena quinquepunctata]|nr:hypothetical protein JTB14_021759 [Gonioctena quinquepunctata]
MIPGSISLAVCTVVLRRMVDTVTGQMLPAIPVSYLPHPSTVLVFSGALYYMYNHLKRGTLVKIGRGPQPRNPTQRLNNRSWFLRNAWGRRRNYTEAIYKIAKQFSESLTNMNPCLLLPKKTFQVSFPQDQSGAMPCREPSPQSLSPTNSCDLIYSNEVFVDDSKAEVKAHVAHIQKAVSSSGDGISKKKGGNKYPKGVKRLVHERKSEKKLSKSISSNCQGDVKKITRSGRVYNPFT